MVTGKVEQLIAVKRHHQHGIVVPHWHHRRLGLLRQKQRQEHPVPVTPHGVVHPQRRNMRLESAYANHEVGEMHRNQT